MSIKTIAFAIIPLLLLLVSNTLASAQTTAAAVVRPLLQRLMKTVSMGLEYCILQTGT